MDIKIMDIKIMDYVILVDIKNNFTCYIIFYINIY